jgi:hypothetical protein
MTLALAGRATCRDLTKERARNSFCYLESAMPACPFTIGWTAPDSLGKNCCHFEKHRN